MAKTHIEIFDTTLRDGEQAPGYSMTPDKKVAYARQAKRLCVDVIEAGFAGASPGEVESIRRIAQFMDTPVVLSLARTKQSDIEAALKSVQGARRPGIHIFIATSDIHLKRKLMMSQQEVLDVACNAIAFAKKYLNYIKFSAEDASRTDIEFLRIVFSEAISSGATVLNIPDTTGCAVPTLFGPFVRDVISGTHGRERVVWSVHCHNDLGNAVANSMVAIENGATQIDCTINGIGERAGNASLEEIVANLHLYGDHYNAETSIDIKEIYTASQLLCALTNSVVQPNKAVIGDNAFAHEAGIHQDGVLKDPLTYEILRPCDFGVDRNKIVLGKHSGRHALAVRLKELGFKPTDQTDMNQIFGSFKKLADQKGRIDDDDLLALIAGDQSDIPQRYRLKYLNVTSSSIAMPHASIVLEIDGEERFGHASGDGMVDACFKTIEHIIGYKPNLEQYSVGAVTGGTDALGEVSCYIEHEGIKTSGQGSHTDIIQASALAYIHALNNLEHRRTFLEKIKDL